MTLLHRIMASIAALVLMTGFAIAQQNPFAPAVLVNNLIVTNFELDQRKRLLALFRTPGDLDAIARDALVDDRLRLGEAKRLGLSPAIEEVETGMEQFAQRANLSREEFIQAISGAGVAEESFRDFVRAGVAWRGVVRALFGPRAQVTEAEVDRALALASQSTGTTVRFAEIILPANNPAATARAERLADQIKATVTTESGFSSFARRYSASPSRARGGVVPNAVPIGNLPPELATRILTLAPGEVSDPIPIPNAIALFQLRAINESEGTTTETVAIEYGQYTLGLAGDDRASGRGARVAAEVDTCDDLYGIAKGEPEETLSIDVFPVEEIPSDLALQLAKLDAGETVVMTRGNARVLVMMCGRTSAIAEGIDRETIRDQLINQRVASYADGFLAELRADAIIREP